MILSVAILIFLGFSTIIQDAGIVGVYGHKIGTLNQSIFGYISYVYPFILLIPAFIFYYKPNFSMRKIEIFLASLLFFLATLMLQSVIVDNGSDLKGSLGFAIVDILSEFIGTFGVWVFIVTIGLLSFCVMFNIGIDDGIVLYKKFFQKNKNIDKNSFENRLESPSYFRRPFGGYFLNKQKNNNKMLLGSKQDFLDTTTDEPFKVEEIVNEENFEDLAINNLSNKKNNLEKNKNKEKYDVEILNEVAENKRLLSQIEFGNVEKPKDFLLPPLNFLIDSPKKVTQINELEVDKKISDLLEKLKRFKVDGDVVRTYAGPVVTTFEFKPAPHVKVSKILTLQDDLAMALMAKTIRIQAPIPGKDVVGIEIPNKNIETIYLKEILGSDLFKKSSSQLTIALGKDIVGNPFITDLKKLPHLLIAGTTGSGKSVGINAMIISLLYRNSPDTLRLMMIDPKMLEFSIYNDIPHLLTPVITQSKQAIVALSNMVAEMERRYKIMANSKTKNIESYNEKVKRDKSAEMLPYVVVIIDELADLMMTSGKDVEVYIARLAQMARASGIHLIVATQRPSVDVVTGLIKANLPSRISYKVGQKIDSKVILDMQGAESLLGRGDMLFTPPGTNGVIRLHAPFTSEKEIEDLVEYLKQQRPTNYNESFLRDSSETSSLNYDGSSEYLNGDIDELFEDAKRIVLTEQKTSISYIQRRLQIGYNRAARIIEQLENTGILSSPNSKGQREIL